MCLTSLSPFIQLIILIVLFIALLIVVAVYGTEVDKWKRAYYQSEEELIELQNKLEQYEDQIE